MNEQLRARYVLDVLSDLKLVSGARLEQWLRPLWDRLANGQVISRGINTLGAPVGYTLDAYWPDGSVSEASSDANYFSKPYKKPRNDFRHALKTVPDVKVVRLFSSQIAEPSVITLFERKKQKLLRRKGYELDLWDARRIAEYIVDYLLIDDRYITRVGDTLPNLRRIAEQNAASNCVPPLSPNYGGRQDEEADVQTRMTQNKTVVIAGFGGIGKTELACAIAHSKRADYDMVIWVDGAKLASVDELKSCDVRLNGYRLNILNLLASSKILLVLDNVSVDLPVEQLDATCGDGSNVLITSQVAFGPNPMQLGFVSDERALEILSMGMNEICPDHVLKAVLKSVEGHPLVLRMLNEFGIRKGQWDAVIRACENIAAAADERRQTVADRILSTHLDTLGPELSLFKWCNSPSVDSVFFEFVFGFVAMDNLERWSLTARGQSDAIRLHDIVFASVRRVSSRIVVEEDLFEEQLQAFLVANIAPKKLDFFRFVHRHAGLVEHNLRANNQPGVLRYAYLHSQIPKNLDPVLLGNPDSDAQQACRGDPRAWMLSLVEAIEADYRRIRDLGNKSAAKSTLEGRLPAFDRLIADQKFPANILAIARHHKAKSLVKLSKVTEALTIFEDLIKDYPTLYASKLQVARLLEVDPERARDLVFEIIEAERDNPGTVSTSVLIETLSLLRRNHLRTYVSTMTERYGEFMASQLKAAACLGEDQPIRAFAAMGPDWAYNHPELFLEVIETIEVGTPDEAEDDNERVAVGRVLCAFGKMLHRKGETAAALQRFEDANNFFSRLTKKPTPFAITHHADVLLRLGRHSDAAKILDTVAIERRDEFWCLRRSEAHLWLDELQEALDKIDAGLAKEPDEDYRATFLSTRADVLHAMKNDSCLDCLKSAIESCGNERYRGDLEEKLRSFRSLQ